MGLGALVTLGAWTALVVKDGESSAMPAALTLGVEGIAGVALLGHAVSSALVARSSPPAVGPRDWRVTARRIAGAGALGLVGYAWYLARWPVVSGAADARYFYPELCGTLSSTLGPGIPLVAGLLLLGVVALSTHVGLGWSQSEPVRASGWSGLGPWIGLSCLALGTMVVLHLATGPLF